MEKKVQREQTGDLVKLKYMGRFFSFSSKKLMRTKSEIFPQQDIKFCMEFLEVSFPSDQAVTYTNSSPCDSTPGACVIPRVTDAVDWCCNPKKLPHFSTWSLVLIPSLFFPGHQQNCSCSQRTEQLGHLIQIKQHQRKISSNSGHFPNEIKKIPKVLCLTWHDLIFLVTD